MSIHGVQWCFGEVAIDRLAGSHKYSFCKTLLAVGLDIMTTGGRPASKDWNGVGCGRMCLCATTTKFAKAARAPQIFGPRLERLLRCELEIAELHELT